MKEIRDTWNNLILKGSGKGERAITSWGISRKLPGVFPKRK